MQIVCLDLEGVLVPEIWIEFAERTGIPELRRTTRDGPNYDVLMKYRLDLLAQHKLGLRDIQAVIAAMGPMPGARAFLDALRADYQVVILSDTFYEFARPLMEQLGWPTLFCHSLEANAEGFLVNYHLRMPNQKQEAVRRFKERLCGNPRPWPFEAARRHLGQHQCRGPRVAGRMDEPRRQGDRTAAGLQGHRQQ